MADTPPHRGDTLNPDCDHPDCRMLGWVRVPSATWGRPWLVCTAHVDWAST